jgi:carboxyl-terminal processing protease
MSCFAVTGALFLLTGSVYCQIRSNDNDRLLEPSDDSSQQALKFARIYGILERRYVEQLNPDHVIMNGAIRGMLSVLDPFSAFFDPDQFQLLQQQTRGEALGFGSILYVQPGKVVVLQTAEGSPSSRAGLGPGDEIVQVNGTWLDRLDFDSLVDLLRRSRSQRVRLGVIHPGKVVPQDFELKPAEVALPTVDKAFLLSPGTGYVHITGFEQKTTQEVVDAIHKLGGANLKGLLLDLRDNHGGMVDAAVGVASLFLQPDLLVLTIRARTQPEKSQRTVPLSSHVDVPLMVLVNDNTASAAEVVTSALQEHDRALIVGEPTFGKGVVETVTTLSENTGLALTTAQYFTASGRSIQRALPGTALAVADSTAGKESHQGGFHTDGGRPVSAGGGITPDVLVPSRELDPWVSFLNQRGLFTSFADHYMMYRGRVTESFEPDSQVIEEFKGFLEKENIGTPEEYWTPDQDYIKLRIKMELVTLARGLDAGYEVEVRGDPQVRKAAALFPQLAELLKASVPAKVASVDKLAHRTLR